MHFDFRNGTFNHLRHAPAATALVHAGGSMCWQDLHAATRTWMQRATAAGARADTSLGILGHDEASFVTAMLGCLSLDVPYVPLDSHDGVYRIRRMVDVAQASLIYDTAADRFMPGPVGTQPLAESGLACILFPRCAQGEPLGAQIGRESIAHLADWLRRPGTLGPAPVCMDHRPVVCGFSLPGIVGALALGGTRVSPAGTAGAPAPACTQQLARYRVTTLIMTRALLSRHLADPHFNGRELRDLRTLVLSAPPLASPQLAGLRLRFPSVHIVSTYGCIEAAGAATWNELDGAAPDSGSGHRIRGQARCYAEVLIRNGEVCVSGNHIMRGYINGAELNRNRLFWHKGKRAYRTGEPGTIDERGLLHWEARGDEPVG
ncbi:AMP-binding protein [Bordetella petrii]|nr:AMP-binding protein [Bordetella petrii]